MVSIGEIIECLNCEVQGKVCSTDVVTMLNLDSPAFKDNNLGWCSDKNHHLLNNVKGGYVIVSHEMVMNLQGMSDQLAFLIVEHPRKSFAKVLNEFFAPRVKLGVISTSSRIATDVEYDESEVNIGENVVIETNCSLGKGVVIGHNTVLKSGTILGDNVRIGSNCTVGGVGFGYEKGAEGNFDLIPHIGNVVLEEYVEVGNNVCIDRAVMGSTILRENVKIDNLVHIAHGVEVGKNSLVIAHAMIAGSVKIGENVWVAPSSSIRQKLSIGDNSLIGLGSVVVKDVLKNEIVAGVPAKPLQKK